MRHQPSPILPFDISVKTAMKSMQRFKQQNNNRVQQTSTEQTSWQKRKARRNSTGEKIAAAEQPRRRRTRSNIEIISNRPRFGVILQQCFWYVRDRCPFLSSSHQSGNLTERSFPSTFVRRNLAFFHLLTDDLMLLVMVTNVLMVQ